MNEIKCFDQTGMELTVNDIVAFKNGRRDEEGCISRLLEDNRILVDCASGKITVNASDCSYI